MNACHDVKELLWDYYDGECDPKTRDSITLHLVNCRNCQAGLDEWIAISHKAFQRTGAKAPAFLWTRVLAGIEAQEQKQGLPWWVQWRWMSRVTSVASVVVGMGAYYLFSNASPPLDALLQGNSIHEKAIQVASAPMANADEAGVTVLEGGQ